MKTAKIVIAPHPALRQAARPVEQVDPKITNLVKTLVATLSATDNPPGVGLAAPQIASGWRIFATQLESSQSEDPIRRAFVNPRISDRSDKQVLGVNPRDPDLEGCLSIPTLYGPVWRAEWVTLEYQLIQESGELSPWHSETFFDFPARVVQHELDHLDGILFTDHILEQGQPLYQEEKHKLVEIDPQVARSL
jgi:peptide deformylase